MKLMATSIMDTAIMATLSATMIIGINGLNLQNANAQTSQPGITSNASSATNATAFITVNPSQSTDKEFWINTVHFDETTNVHSGVICVTHVLKTLRYIQLNSLLPIQLFRWEEVSG